MNHMGRGKGMSRGHNKRGTAKGGGADLFEEEGTKTDLLEEA